MTIEIKKNNKDEHKVTGRTEQYKVHKRNQNAIMGNS